MLKIWEEHAIHMSVYQALAFAKENNFGFKFDWEKCRTEEGYY